MSDSYGGNGNQGEQPKPEATDVSPYLNLLLWFFLPNWLTNVGLSWYYKLFVPLPQRPAAGTPRAAKHRARMYCLVIATYLVYSVWQIWITQPPSEYAILGMSPPRHPAPMLVAADRPAAAAEWAGEWATSVRSKFRKQALQLHPDRNRHPDAPQQFMRVQRASAVLSDARARLIYDAMGSAAALECLEATSAGRSAAAANEACNYAPALARHLVQRVFPFYLVWGLLLAFMALFRALGTAQYWRVAGLAAVCTLELAVVTRRLPDFLHVALAVIGLAPHEAVAMAHQMLPLALVAVHQIGPVLPTALGAFAIADADADAANTAADSSALLAMLQAPAQLAASTFSVLRDSIARDWEPFAASGSVSDTSGSRASATADAHGVLKRRMEQVLVDGILRQRDPEYDAIFAEALQRHSQKD